MMYPSVRPYTRRPEPRRAKAQNHCIRRHHAARPTLGRSNSMNNKLSVVHHRILDRRRFSARDGLPLSPFTSPYVSLDHQPCSKHLHENGNSMRTHEQENRQRNVVQSVDVEVVCRGNKDVGPGLSQHANGLSVAPGQATRSIVVSS